LGEKFIGRIPLVKTVYGAVRDLLGFFSQPGSDRAVSKVVIVTFGTSDMRAVGLLTRERFEDLPQGLGGEGYVVVFFPYSYQVGGLTMIVPRQSVQSLDMRLEDAMRFIVTAGAKAGESRSPQKHPDSAESVGATVREWGASRSARTPGWKEARGHNVPSTSGRMKAARRRAARPARRVCSAAMICARSNRRRSPETHQVGRQ
jgi:hypothetical protein